MIFNIVFATLSQFEAGAAWVSHLHFSLNVYEPTSVVLCVVKSADMVTQRWIAAAWMSKNVPLDMLTLTELPAVKLSWANDLLPVVSRS